MSGSHNYCTQPQRPGHMLAGEKLDDSHEYKTKGRHEYESKGHLSDASQASSAKAGGGGTKQGPQPRSRIRRRRPRRRRRVVESSEVQNFLHGHEKLDSSLVPNALEAGKLPAGLVRQNYYDKLESSSGSSSRSLSPSRESPADHVTLRSSGADSGSRSSDSGQYASGERKSEETVPEIKRRKLDLKEHSDTSRPSLPFVTSSTPLLWRQRVVVPLSEKEAVFVTGQKEATFFTGQDPFGTSGQRTFYTPEKDSKPGQNLLSSCENSSASKRQDTSDSNVSSQKLYASGNNPASQSMNSFEDRSDSQTEYASDIDPVLKRLYAFENDPTSRRLFSSGNVPESRGPCASENEHKSQILYSAENDPELKRLYISDNDLSTRGLYGSDNDSKSRNDHAPQRLSVSENDPASLQDAGSFSKTYSKSDEDYATDSTSVDRTIPILFLTPLERLQRDCVLPAGDTRTETPECSVTPYQRYSSSTAKSVSARSVSPPSLDSFTDEQKQLVVAPAWRSHSERNTKSSDGRCYNPGFEPHGKDSKLLLTLDSPHGKDSKMLLTPDSPAMGDFPDAADTCPIVTPTRRRSNDKSPHGKHFIRRDVSGLEYPDGHTSADRGRSFGSEKVSSARLGAIWLHPTMFRDTTSSTGSKIMSEIEMANLRSNNPTPEYDVPYAGEVPSAQDHLLTGNHVRNGSGSPGSCYQQYKQQNVYEIGMHRPKPASHGSGMVFRRKKKPCWCVLLVLVALALMAAGISLGVLFGVVRKGESEHSVQVGEAPKNNSIHTVVVVKNGNATTQASSTRGQVPARTPSPTLQTDPSAPSSGTDNSGPGPRWEVSVRRFRAFWHPGDSRVLEILLSNGTKLLAAGHKANDGTFKGLYSLTLIDGQRRTTRVRFMGLNNLASVILPDGTIVSLDWSSNNQDVECKVFQIPPLLTPLTGGGGSGVRDLNRPTTHLATLQMGVHSYLLRQVSRIINEAATDPTDSEEPINPNARKICTPRLPVKVTKCGGQYPYDGAFVQGDVTIETGATLPMAALPWRRDDDDDDCYGTFRESAPNFFIPLPGYIDQTTARQIAGRFLSTASRWWGRVCNVVGSVLEVDIERHEVCANMAVSAQTQLSHNNLYRMVYDSCIALLSSLHIACRALDEVSVWASASNHPNGDGGRDSNRASSDATGDNSRQLPAHSILEKALANATSLQEPPTSRQQNIDVKTYAFCPSTQPLTSYEKSIYLQTPMGGGNISMAGIGTMHVNCMGHPEVTYFYLGHAAADNLVKHRLQVCAVCAFEKTISVHVLRDLMCCNDTCTRESRCEESTSERGQGLSESHTFSEQNSVYCHEFLTGADMPLPSLSPGCKYGTCQSSLQVRFQVKDEDPSGLGERVYLDQVLACHEGFRTTCKSTFGH